ncbi:hypothetical protein KM043_015514 [Ampulex compressa]|nr:hypothetical protein KM043_015514 [Ampulex compressa]
MATLANVAAAEQCGGNEMLKRLLIGERIGHDAGASTEPQTSGLRRAAVPPTANASLTIPRYVNVTFNFVDLIVDLEDLRRATENRPVLCVRYD